MSRRRVRLQLGGMCRTPSSRIVRDGMASESLNLASDLDETVPVLPPELVEGEDIPDSWRAENGEMVFVHVQPNYTNHVYQVGSSDGTTGIGTWAKEGDGWEFTAFLTMEKGETLNDIVNIGNTLVVSTSEATHYVLYKEGAYRDLGTELPKPCIRFVGDEREQHNIFFTPDDYNVADEEEKAWKEEIWLEQPYINTTDPVSITEGMRYGKDNAGNGKYFVGTVKYDVDDDSDANTRNARTQALWDAYADAVAYAAKFNLLDDEDGGKSVNGYAFYQPYLFRYALRLYDGTYARQSVPVLVGGGANWPVLLATADFTSSNPRRANNNHDHKGHYAVAMVPLFSVQAMMQEEVSQDWADIVTAVDIFCSSPINVIDPGDSNITYREKIYITYIHDFCRSSESGFLDNSDYKKVATDPGENDIYELERYGKDDSFEDCLLNHNVFYRIGSFLIDNSAKSLSDDYDPTQEFTANQSDLYSMTSMDKGGGRGLRLKKPDADTLVTHKNTASDDWDDFECDHTFHGNVQKVMNQRLAIWDIDKTLGTGLPSLNSLTADCATYDSPYYKTPFFSTYKYRFLYVIDDNGTDRYVWGRDGEGNDELLPKWFLPYAFGKNNEVNIANAYGWLAYPDKNCKRVIIGRCEMLGVTQADGFIWQGAGSYDSTKYVLQMKEHPFLNCAYAWLGFGNRLAENVSTASADDAAVFDSGAEDRLVRDTNTIMLSGAANPFTFPTAGRYTFDYAVISCATANMPLSTGQFGQFPLYVFTKGGIWAMAMNTDGTFASSSPFSRDVAVSHKGVCEIDQGVVFVATKAVMAIQGGQITDISQLMTGARESVPPALISVLDGSDYGKTVTDSNGDEVTAVGICDLVDSEWFGAGELMNFMKHATAGYDYLGDRVVFTAYNDEADYQFQWAWMRKTATWHRTAICEGDYYNALGLTRHSSSLIRITSFVNSWPGLIANLTTGSRNAAGEMTSQLDRTRDGNLASTGLYVSRPLTLDNPDVFKSVMDLRIRGDLKRGNAKHLLLSSNNGHDWVLRTSLRGPSFKFHRLVTVTRMTTAERLSYIDVEVDDRLTNRMR